VVVHPDDLPPLMAKWTELEASQKSGKVEVRVRRHDGVYRWFLIGVEPFRDENGNVVRWSWMLREQGESVESKQRGSKRLHKDRTI
jgi:PAS domain-containing protein